MNPLLSLTSLPQRPFLTLVRAPRIFQRLADMSVFYAFSSKMSVAWTIAIEVAT